jgi:hypothetical protein
MNAGMSEALQQAQGFVGDLLRPGVAPGPFLGPLQDALHGLRMVS